MATLLRSKRVTDPFDDEAKARLVGGRLSGVSSGSEHSGYNDCDDSPCLSELVHGFLEDDSHTGLQCCDSDSDSDRVASAADCTDAIEEIARLGANNHSDAYRKLLLAHVLKAMEAFSCFKSQRTVLRRKVMSFLRELGHNAAICKTKWESSGGLTGGNYEFIDVVVQLRGATSPVRYFVDLDFASEFEIARPTGQYTRLVQLLPMVFVGRGDDLKRIVRIVCDAARKSLKSRGLSVPPWRKNRYMQTKWLGPYRRTTSPTPGASFTPSINSVKCRSVGFDDALNGRQFVRTR